jgi:hypothetical protein
VHASIRFLQDGWHVQDRNSTNGTWLDGTCLTRGHTRALAPGALLRFGARGREEWQLSDASPPSTRPIETKPYVPSVQQIELAIHADLALELDVYGQSYRLPARVPYLVLQALAQERLGDRERGTPEADAGWVDREQLSRRLRRSELNQDIRRIRDDFKKLQLFGAAEDVIESSREQGKIRIGISHVRLID